MIKIISAWVQNLFNAGQQFGRAQWFCNVVVHLGNMQPQDLVDVLCLGCDHDHRNVACGFIGFHLLIYFPTIHVWHHQIQQDKVWKRFLYFLYSIQSAGGTVNIIATPSEDQAHEVDHFGFILDAEDFLFIHMETPVFGAKFTIKRCYKIMKIISWNVNGIRAAINKDALDWAFGQKPDALCLQEVKARPEQLNET